MGPHIWIWIYIIGECPFFYLLTLVHIESLIKTVIYAVFELGYGTVSNQAAVFKPGYGTVFEPDYRHW